MSFSQPSLDEEEIVFKGRCKNGRAINANVPQPTSETQPDLTLSGAVDEMESILLSGGRYSALSPSVSEHPLSDTEDQSFDDDTLHYDPLPNQILETTAFHGRAQSPRSMPRQRNKGHLTSAEFLGEVEDAGIEEVCNLFDLMNRERASVSLGTSGSKTHQQFSTSVPSHAGAMLLAFGRFETLIHV